MTNKNKSVFVQKEHLYTLNGITFSVVDTVPNHSLNDDDIYLNDEYWNTITRGHCDVFVCDNNTKTLIHQLRGLKKYGDENDSFGPHNKEKSSSFKKEVFATVKANGECFHVSFFKYQSCVYSILGSKNVHILISINDDIQKQLDDIIETQKNRVTYASKMTSYFFKNIGENKEKLINYILDNGVTFVGEYINPEHQHVVKYEKECIHFFAITHPNSMYLYTYLNPSNSFELFKEFGCETVDYILCKSQLELDQVKEKYFNYTNCEGLVLYYIDENDSVYNMFKFKNKQYTILRTVREYYNANKMLSTFIKRLKEYHITLTFDEIELYTSFFIWLKHKCDFTHFSVDLFNTFLKEDKLQLTIKNSEKIIIVLIGIPGTGKTTVGSELSYYFNKNGVPTVYIDQDLNYGDLKKFDNQLKHYIQLDKKECSIIIVGKSHTTSFTRENSLKYVTLEQLYFVSFDIPKNKEEKELCIKRISERPYHMNLFSNKAKDVVESFCVKYEPFNKETETIGLNVNGIINLSVNDTIHTKCNKIVSEIIQKNPNLKFDEMDLNFNSNFIWCQYVGIDISFKVLKDFIETNSKVYQIQKEDLNCYVTHTPHITCIHSDYMKYKLDSEKDNIKVLKYWNDKVGQQVSFKIDKIMWTDEISAFFISFISEDDKIINKYPHISWQRKNTSIKAYTSNVICESSNFKVEYFCDSDNKSNILTGVVKRY